MNSCTVKMEREKSWPYDQYYIGSKDGKERRNGLGENHWTGAKSLEQYIGNFVNDAMNGQGDYTWRYAAPDGTHLTYEGYFFANQIHGYGVMSYPDGRTFTGIFNNNMRWGPGIQRHVNMQADVGFWRNSQLVRLAWRPKGINVIPTFLEPRKKPFGDKHRVLLAKKCTIIGETNDALQLLKHYGADPVWASKNWHKLYSPYCTDLKSLACQVSLFERNYYKGKYLTLQEITCPVPEKELTPSEQEVLSPRDPDLIIEHYYSWNNNKMIVDMMKHCYQHEKFRNSHLILPFTKILNGPRRHLRLAGLHERHCRNLIMASYLGYISDVVALVNEEYVYPDVADIQGNTPLIYATCGDHPTVIEFLVDAGADVNGFNDSCCNALGIALIRFVCAVKNVGIKQVLTSFLPETPPVNDFAVNEWIIDRSIPLQTTTEGLQDAQRSSKLSIFNKVSMNSKKSSKSMSKRVLVQPVLVKENEYDSEDSFSDEMKLYTNLRHEYDSKIKETVSESPDVAVPYLFSVECMDKNIDIVMTAHMQKVVESKNKDLKKTTTKEDKSQKFEAKKPISVMKITEGPINTIYTIKQLLKSGADPRLVVFPQPALFMAIIAGSPTVVKLLLEHGVDVNEKYTAAIYYTALDVAVSRQVSPGILDIVELLLSHGANADHRLPYPDDEPGPTLLHAVITKPQVTTQDEELCEKLFTLLLKHSNPFIQYKGVSAAELTIATNIKFLHCLCKFPTIDLNTIINSNNHTILPELFTWTTFRQNLGSDININALIKELVINGASPLLPCVNNQEEYISIFEYARTVLLTIDPSHSSTEEVQKSASASEPDVRETQKPNLRNVHVLKKTECPPQAQVIAYKNAIEVMVVHTRAIHARYLQANMVKSLVNVIYKFKHRHWHMIFKEFKKHILFASGIWLTPLCCFDIWHMLANTTNKMYKDDTTLRHLIGIILFHNYENKNNMPNSPKHNIIASLTGRKRRKIDADTKVLIRNYKENNKKPPEIIKFYKNAYLKPELAAEDDEKLFDICFNCCMPLNLFKYRIKCILCKTATFCSSNCMMHSIEETDSHPCTKFLKEQASTDITTGGE